MTEETIKLRPGQEKILQYQGGRMGISAVPGSGKTWTLSYLAANLIQSGAISPDQEILIVTLVNAAVDNFSNRISSQLIAARLLPGYGYRVRTLHGLANDIVRERPDLAGLGTSYQIIDDVESTAIKQRVARDWLHAHINFFEPYLEYEDHQQETIYENNNNLPRLVETIATAFIRLAKDRQLTPDALRQLLSKSQLSMPLVQMGTEIYSEYHNALKYRASVDFDDLIRLAYRCLKSDPALVELLRKRWPYILEDETQDSSHLQESILSILTGENGNWVRVGDPNQAIFETFTTASPQFLLNFLEKPDVTARSLPESGRSTLSIIDLANHLIEWTRKSHPNLEARNALNPPLIQPTPIDDPQPNPSDCPDCIQLIEQSFTSEAEIRFVVDQITTFLTEHPEKTLAVLAPSNSRCFRFVDELKKRGVPYVDSLLRSTTATRLSTGAIANILNHLVDPQSSSKLSLAYQVWRRAERENEEQWSFVKSIGGLIQKCKHIEEYLWPSPLDPWLTQIEESQDNPAVSEELRAFREVVHHWQQATLLPIDQLVLSISQELFLDPTELALAHKLSSLLRQLSNAHPDWRLPEFTDELVNIAKNQRRYLGFSQEDAAFNPDLYPGRVVVTTMHKAKGLEWDCVFLTSVNNYDFPSGDDYDQFQSEKWFIKDHLNLEAETIAQLKTLIEGNPFDWFQLGTASQDARLELIRERLRLFFVGITRARRWLTITWNIGRPSHQNFPSIPLLELINYLEKPS